MPISEHDRRFAEVFAELQALRLIVNEAFSMVLSLGDDPVAAGVTTRHHVKETLERTEAMAAGGEGMPGFRKFVGKVEESISGQLDAVERLVSQLRHGRATH
ncbi:MAG: hypothetical protein FWD12_04025 [Alphaproteobacteria bacterium]|nr:hypothetical protein [Alphaproteobacteria bacterium]